MILFFFLESLIFTDVSHVSHQCFKSTSKSKIT